MSSGEQVIAVIGPIGAGKSSFIQNSLPPGLRHKVKVGHGFQPETKQVQPVNWVTEDGTRVKLLDTPGLDNSRSIMTDVKTLKMIATFLINEVQRKGSHLAGVIYIHQINDTGVGGNAQRNLRTFQQLCGNNSVMKVVIVTTMWDVVTSEKGSRLEQELSWSDSLFKPLLDEGAIMMRHDKPPESAMSAINHILGKKTIITQIVREPVQERKALEDSAAGTPHHSENRPLVQKHKEESKLLKAVMRGALQNIQGLPQVNTIHTNGERVIAVMGRTGVGKSSFIQNSLPPSLRATVKVGHSLQYETHQVQPISWVTEDGTRVKLLDTPGFDDFHAGMTDIEVLKMIEAFLTNEYRGEPRLTGLIYVHRITDFREGGTVRRYLRILRKLCGDDSLKNVVITTTMWDQVVLEKGLRREQELKSSDSLFKPLLDNGAIMMRHDRIPESASNVINYLLGNNATTTQIVRKPVRERNALDNTAASSEPHSEVSALLQKHKKEMESLEAEMRRMLQNVQDRHPKVDTIHPSGEQVIAGPQAGHDRKALDDTITIAALQDKIRELLGGMESLKAENAQYRKKISDEIELLKTELQITQDRYGRVDSAHPNGERVNAPPRTVHDGALKDTAAVAELRSEIHELLKKHKEEMERKAEIMQNAQYNSMIKVSAIDQLSLKSKYPQLSTNKSHPTPGDIANQKTLVSSLHVSDGSSEVTRSTKRTLTRILLALRTRVGFIPRGSDLVSPGQDIAQCRRAPVQSPTPSSFRDPAHCLSDHLDQQADPADVEEAIELINSVLELQSPGSLDWMESHKFLMLYRQKQIAKQTPKADLEHVRKLVMDAVYGILDFLPPRLLNTHTCTLCDRDGLVSAFENSQECKQLLSSAITHPSTLHDGIRKTVSTYFNYATLSHRWGSDEPLLHHIQGQVIYKMNPTEGLLKLHSFCIIACSHGYLWAWSDTCCIDKSSTVELARAIASMFLWYWRSALTIVYLADIPGGGILSKSAWFTRGWTLQELLAPRNILFYTKDWSLYKDRSSNHKEDDIVLNELECATSITRSFLTDFNPGLDNARLRLQWASRRHTTQPEDIAYSLFGIFKVFLPIIPSEPAENALKRLLVEIMSKSGDVSVLSWVGEPSQFHSFLPAHIASYQTATDLPPNELKLSLPDTHLAMRNKLLDSLSTLDPPQFIDSRLRLPCLVYQVKAVQLKMTHDRTQNYVYNIQTEGLLPFEIALSNELKAISDDRPPYVLIRPCDSKLLDLSAKVGDSIADQVVKMLGEPFDALLLKKELRNDYRRVASSSRIVACPTDVASILQSTVQSLIVV